MLEAASEAEAAPQTPRTPTTEDIEYPSPSLPNSQQPSDYTSSMPNLDSDNTRMASINVQRTTSIGDSAFDGAVSEDRPQSDMLGQDPQYSGSGGMPQTSANLTLKGTRGKVRNALSKMAHGVTGAKATAGSENVAEMAVSNSCKCKQLMHSGLRGLIITNFHTDFMRVHH